VKKIILSIKEREKFVIPSGSILSQALIGIMLGDGQTSKRSNLGQFLINLLNVK